MKNEPKIVSIWQLRSCDKKISHKCFYCHKLLSDHLQSAIFHLDGEIIKKSQEKYLTRPVFDLKLFKEPKTIKKKRKKRRKVIDVQPAAKVGLFGQDISSEAQHSTN